MRIGHDRALAAPWTTRAIDEPDFAAGILSGRFGVDSLALELCTLLPTAMLKGAAEIAAEAGLPASRGHVDGFATAGTLANLPCELRV